MITRLMSMGVPADLVREILAGAEWRIVRGRLYVKSSGGVTNVTLLDVTNDT